MRTFAIILVSVAVFAAVCEARRKGPCKTTAAAAGATEPTAKAAARQIDVGSLPSPNGTLNDAARHRRPYTSRPSRPSSTAAVTDVTTESAPEATGEPAEAKQFCAFFPFLCPPRRTTRRPRGNTTIAASTEAPTQAPTDAPTQAPTEVQTAAPTEAPTPAPTEVQTVATTQAPAEAASTNVPDATVPDTTAPEPSSTEAPAAEARRKGGNGQGNNGNGIDNNGPRRPCTTGAPAAGFSTESATATTTTA